MPEPSGCSPCKTYVQTRLGRLGSSIQLVRSFRAGWIGVASAAVVALGSGGGMARAATCTWSNVAAGNYSTGIWSCGHAPTSSDDVFFDKTNGTNVGCTFDVAVNVNSITFQNAYSATVTGGAPSIVVVGGWTMSTGTFTGGGGTVQMGGTISLTGGTFTAPTGTVQIGGGLSLSGGTFTASSGTVQIGGAFTRTSGTFTASTGTVILNATGPVTHSFGSRTFNKLIVNDGLVGYWNLDENGGTALADRSGYNNNLTLSAASFTTSVPSVNFADTSGVAFTGAVSAQLAATPPTRFPAATAAESISVWVKLGATTGTQDMVALGDGTNGVKLGLNGGILSAWTWGGTSLVTGTTPVDGNWHQVVLTYDGSTNKLYLDGVLANSTGTARVAATTTKAYLGTYDGVHELMASGGALDDVRIYNRALTLTEVSGLALGGMPATGAVTHTFNDNFAASGDVVIASGVVTSPHAVTVGGSWLNYGGISTETGTLTLNGGSGVLLSGGQVMAGNLTISSGSYTLADRLWAGNRTLTVNGTLNGGSYVVHAGTLVGSGTFAAGTGTVVLDNTQTLGTSLASAFYNLRIEDPTETNLVAYWKLDEVNGTSFADLSGTTGNTGTLVGGASWTTAAPSIGFDDAAGLSFDGSTGYASMGTNKVPAANKSQTISFWAKFPSTSGVHDMVTLMDAADASGLEIGINGGNLNVWEYGGPILISMVAPSINTWHHIAYVYNTAGAGTDQLYVDGVVNTGGGNTTTHQTGTPTVAYLGTWNAGSELYNGQLDDVRVYSTALSSTQVAQLAAGRYAGTGGYGTVTLGVGVTAGGLLALDAGNLDANGNTMNASLASSVTTGTYTVGSAAQTFSGGLTVQPSGTLTLLSGTGSVSLGNGKGLTIDGTLNASAAGATIKSSSGSYTFKVGSVATATPTLNITGLAVQNTDTNGMWIDADTGATTTFTRFDNIAFSSGTGAQLLQIYAATLYLGSGGCTFDGSTTVAVKLTGNGTGVDGTETRAVFGGATCATNTAGICATSEKSDDDANNDGIGDNLASNGAVVQFARSASYAGGTFQGFPTAAFDWNTFTYYATYAVFRNEAGSADIVYVRDESGNALYSWTTGTNENIIGTPQWTTVAGTHYVYVATNNTANTGKVYRLVDNGTSLALDAVWSALAGGNPYACTCTIKSQLSLDANNVYWAGTTGSGGTLTQLLMEIGQTSQSVLTGWPLTTPASVTTSSPQLATSGGTTKVYLGISGDLLQLDVTGTTFVTNSNPGTINGRVSIGTSSASGITRVFAGDTSKVMWAISPTNFTGANYLWKYTAASSIGGSNYYDYLTDTVQFGTAGGTVIVLTGAGNGGSPGTGVVLNASYPFTLNASDPITSAPLYTGGVMVVGTTLGKLYFLDRNTGTSPGVSIIAEYYFGPTESVSAIGFDSNVNRYMVSTSAATKDGRLYYFDLVSDPTPTFK